MPKARPLIASFNGGELSPLMEGRADFPKYTSGCRLLENWFPLIQGGITKRPGTIWGGGARHNDETARLIPFQFSTSQSYMLEFGETYLRIWINNALVTDNNETISGATQADPCVITATGHSLSNGERVVITGVAGMVELNNREFIVANAGANDFEIQDVDGNDVDATGYTAYSSGGDADRIYEVTTPYDADDVAQLSHAQSADVLYLAHPEYAPRKVERSGNTSWTITEIDFDWLPFERENTSDIELDIDSASIAGCEPGQSVTLFANGGNLFDASRDVGRYVKLAMNPGDAMILWEPEDGGTHTGGLIGIGTEFYYQDNCYRATTGTNLPTGSTPPVHRIYGQVHDDGGGLFHKYIHSGVGYVEITAVSSATQATATVIKEIPTYLHRKSGGHANHGNAKRWAWSAWDPANKYPRAVTFFEDRLWWAGADGAPNSFHGSRPGIYEDHELFDSDESAVFFALNTDQVNAIEWMQARKVLLMGTSRSEWSVSASTGTRDAISAGNVRADDNSTEGSKAAVTPVPINDAVVFVQRDGRKVNELVFDFDTTDQYVARDLTRLAEHITQAGVKQFAWAQEPFRLLWVLLDDGKLLAMTYERREDVISWHRHPLGGTDVFVESIAVIPRAAPGGDELWMLVRRTIDGNTVRYVEYLSPEWRRGNDLEDARFQDSGATYDGAATTEITGLWHLNGETSSTLSVLADGEALTSIEFGTITNGKLTLTEASSVVQVGLGYIAKAETMRLEAALQDGTAQGRRATLKQLVLRLDQAGEGLKVAPDQNAVSYRVDMSDPSDSGTPIPLRDWDSQVIHLAGGTERYGRRIYLEHDKPLPCTVLAAMPDYNVEGR